MCNHLDTSKLLIEEITHQVYPSVELQFIQIFADENDTLLETLLNKLHNEFRSLLTCEKTMVFPAILKVFNKEKIENGGLPSIADMMKLTRNKEAKMVLLVADLKTYLSRHSSELHHSEIQKLIVLFEKSFIPMKIKWNQMVDDRTKTCACFQLYTANILNPNKNEEGKE